MFKAFRGRRNKEASKENVQAANAVPTSRDKAGSYHRYADNNVLAGGSATNRNYTHGLTVTQSGSTGSSGQGLPRKVSFENLNGSREVVVEEKVNFVNLEGMGETVTGTHSEVQPKADSSILTRLLPFRNRLSSANQGSKISESQAQQRMQYEDVEEEEEKEAEIFQLSELDVTDLYQSENVMYDDLHVEHVTENISVPQEEEIDDEKESEANSNDIVLNPMLNDNNAFRNEINALVQLERVSTDAGFENNINALIEEALKSEETAPYSRSKLMVVGEGRAGKTCTIRSLLNKVFDAEEPSTKGFDVTRVHASNWKEDEKGYLVEQLEKLVKHKEEEKKKEPNEPIVILEEPTHVFTRNQFVSMIDIPQDQKYASSVSDDNRSDNNDSNSMATDEAEKFAELRNKKKIDVDEEEIQRYGRNFNFSQDKEDTLSFSIWDFGGQKVFYSLHHLFLTEFGCYILVFKVLSLLNESTRQSTIDYMKFWLFSKKIHAPTAPILIVGTHADEINNSDIAELNTIVSKSVLGTNNFGEIQNKGLNFFPIDNKSGSGVTELRERIEVVVKAQEYIKRCVPISFLRVIELLLERNEPFLPINEARELVACCGLDDFFFETALSFLSQRGLITFFPEHETLRRYIILQPQWLISAITDVVYDEGEHAMPIFDTEFARDFRKFNKERILTKSLLENIWDKKEYPRELQKFLVRVMCKSSLMCNYRFDNSESYLVPSLFTMNVTGECEIDDSEYTGPDFVIDFSGDYSTEITRDDGKLFVRYMPYGFFERLVCLCVEHSAHYEDSMKPIIGNKIASLSFGTDVDFEIKVVNNLQGYPLWIKVSTEEDTEIEVVRDLVKNIYSMIDGLKNDFFAKNTEAAKLAISLLLPSTDDSGNYYADYGELSIAFGKKKLPKNIRPNKTKKKKVKVKHYSQWFPSNGTGDGFVNLVEPEKNIPSSKEEIQMAVALSDDTPLKLPSFLEHHCFLSYRQSSAIDIVGKQYYILSSKGLKCWYDQQLRGAINLQNMMEGVKNSMCYILFLSKDIFPSAYVEAEVTMALELKKPIIFLHHPDTGKVGYWDFGDYISNAPAIVKPLFAKIESIQLQRRHYLEEAVTMEIYNRLSQIHQDVVGSLI